MTSRIAQSVEDCGAGASARRSRPSATACVSELQPCFFAISAVLRALRRDATNCSSSARIVPSASARSKRVHPRFARREGFSLLRAVCARSGRVEVAPCSRRNLPSCARATSLAPPRWPISLLIYHLMMFVGSLSGFPSHTRNHRLDTPMVTKNVTLAKVGAPHSKLINPETLL